MVPMTLHEFVLGMTVMDGRRCVATARREGCGLWVITLRGAWWIDLMVDPVRIAQRERLGIGFKTGANLKVCKTKRQVRREMRSVAGLQ